MAGFPDVRLRRLRRTEGLRRLTGLALPGPEKFMWPVFVVEGSGLEIDIESMPGQSRYSVDRLVAALEPVVASGVGSVLIFGVVDEHKDASGTHAHDDSGVVQRAVAAVRDAFPDLLIATDVCLCAYTDHGHCGTLTDSGDVNNDVTLKNLAKTAVSHAAAGADIVAPSAMMDGQVQAIREALNEAGAHETILMSYSTKFASAMYGPFREAAHSAPGKGDRRAYQAPYQDPRQALRESRFDVEEGADILMVKPSLFYLDLLQQIRAEHDLPIAAYNVSGEYAMLCATAAKGWGDLDAMVRESTMALVRAGTDILISYWANQYERIFARDA